MGSNIKGTKIVSRFLSPLDLGNALKNFTPSLLPSLLYCEVLRKTANQRRQKLWKPKRLRQAKLDRLPDTLPLIVDIGGGYIFPKRCVISVVNHSIIESLN